VRSVVAMLLVACSTPAPKPVACPATPRHEPRRALDDPSGGAVEGLITDDKTCAPLAAATVIVAGPASEIPVLSGDDGRYLVTGLMPGKYKMMIYFCDGSTARDVTVVAGYATRLDVVMTAQCRGEI
jgi:hypothetical protein